MFSHRHPGIKQWTSLKFSEGHLLRMIILFAPNSHADEKIIFVVLKKKIQ